MSFQRKNLSEDSNPSLVALVGLFLAILAGVIWAGIYVMKFLSNFLTYFLLSYLTRFGYFDNQWVEPTAHAIALMMVIILGYFLWKDFGEKRFADILNRLRAGKIK